MTTPTPELLSEMSKMTVLSGRVNDIQIRNLQMFPLVFFQDVTEVKIDYDLSHKQDIMEDELTNRIIIKAPVRNSHVSYYLTLDENKNTDLDKRYMALEKSVRTLFWNDVSVEVYFNGLIKYKSAKV